jgi:uncharacterized protein YkwD
MTLTKTKPRRPTAAHRKRTGTHHKRDNHYVKAYWPYLPIVAILAVGLFASSWLSHSRRDVLGYATEMSVQNLLDGTNNQRVANGLGSLALNGKLNTAAQNKANDMAARNYWSHNTPDGQTPWTFITAAGYDYQTAGENLAYGFATSADTITGWMNSAPHRANILNSNFVDVGFGIVNIPNYQNSGPETLVVAMYGKPASPAVAAATPPPTTSSQPVHTTTPTPVADSEPTPTPATETPAPASDTVKPTKQKEDTVIADNTPVNAASEKRVARIQIVTAGKASWSLFALSLIACGALIIFLTHHAVAWHRVIRRGERFMFKHPLLDIVIMGVATLAYIMTQTSGLIR